MLANILWDWWTWWLGSETSFPRIHLCDFQTQWQLNIETQPLSDAWEKQMCMFKYWGGQSKGGAGCLPLSNNILPFYYWKDCGCSGTVVRKEPVSSIWKARGDSVHTGWYPTTYFQEPWRRTILL